MASSHTHVRFIWASVCPEDILLDEVRGVECQGSLSVIPSMELYSNAGGAGWEILIGFSPIMFDGTA